MHIIYLALGSNKGDRQLNIDHAKKLLSEKVILRMFGPVYESKAHGFEAQDDFLNTVIQGETDLDPRGLLAFIKDIEVRVGRTPSFHWGPREIDIDILFYDNLIYKDDMLEIPHPQIENRDFVLVPLSDIAADFVHPTLNKNIANLLENIPKDKRSIIR